MNKELYHLCRKYRYFYKKCKALDEFSEEFYDENVMKSKAKTVAMVNELEKDIGATMVAECLDTVSDFSLEHEHPSPDYGFGGRMHRCLNIPVTTRISFVDSGDKKFEKLLSDAIMKKYYMW